MTAPTKPVIPPIPRNDLLRADAIDPLTCEPVLIVDRRMESTNGIVGVIRVGQHITPFHIRYCFAASLRMIGGS